MTGQWQPDSEEAAAGIRWWDRQRFKLKLQVPTRGWVRQAPQGGGRTRACRCRQGAPGGSGAHAAVAGQGPVDGFAGITGDLVNSALRRKKVPADLKKMRTGRCCASASANHHTAPGIDRRLSGNVDFSSKGAGPRS